MSIKINMSYPDWLEMYKRRQGGRTMSKEAQEILDDEERRQLKRAAAPKLLLEACKAAEIHYAMLCEVICADNPPPGGMPILVQLRDAIAKAEGGK